MNFFKTTKYKLSGSSKKNKNEPAPKAEQFHRLDSPGLDKQPAKAKAPAAPSTQANDVTACFGLKNLTAFAWKLDEAASPPAKALFPKEIAPNEGAVIRLNDSNNDISAAEYTFENDNIKYGVKINLTKKESRWLIAVEWKGFGADVTGFEFKPEFTGSEKEVELPSPDGETFTVELTYNTVQD